MNDQPTISLEELPWHELRKRVSDAKIKMKPNSKKVDYIEALETGKSNIEVREAKRMPHLEESKTAKSVSLLPENFEVIIATKYPNLAFDIDEESNCINFRPSMPGDRSVIPSCINIDNSERLIYKAAEQASRGRTGSVIIDDRNNAQAGRINQEIRDRKILEAEIRTKIVNEQGTA